MITQTATKQAKAKKCRVCKSEFQPRTPLQIVCAPPCGIEYANKQRSLKDNAIAREERQKTKTRKEAIKSRSDWAREAQTAVNNYVRERDKDLPCISCGRHHQGQYHAGHYLSRGAHPELAYTEDNLAKQCQPCNTHLSGNQINFRKGLIQRIGIERVEWLEGPHEPIKRTIDNLKEIRDLYRLKLKELRANQ